MADGPNSLLEPDSLHGIRVGISASESADLSRLGLMEAHFRLALAEIARSVLVSGGKLTYGGHLDPQGYTAMLVGELQRYSRRDRPLQVVLAWPEHRRMALSEIHKQRDDLGLSGEIVCVDLDGQPIPPEKERTEQVLTNIDEGQRQQGLTNFRKFLSENTQARVLIGGKRTDFQGVLPGILEEALFSLRRKQPLYLAGGFGGMTLDVIRSIDREMAEWLPAYDGAPAPDDRAIAGLNDVAATATELGWAILDNGLTRDENAQLAATHRPSEIATLVSVGIGRRFRRT